MPLSARIVIFFSGVALFVIVFELVRKKKFREELSIIWLFFALVVASGSIIDLVIDPLARILRIGYPPAIGFMMISLVLIASLLYFSLITSDLKGKVKELTQKIALLEQELNEREGPSHEG